jgi:hypothetical protein
MVTIKQLNKLCGKYCKNVKSCPNPYCMHRRRNEAASALIDLRNFTPRPSQTIPSPIPSSKERKEANKNDRWIGEVARLCVNILQQKTPMGVQKSLIRLFRTLRCKNSTRTPSPSKYKYKAASSGHDNNTYEVESILGVRVKDGTFEALLKWKGYDETTWEPTESFYHSNPILQDVILHTQLNTHVTQHTCNAPICSVSFLLFVPVIFQFSTVFKALSSFIQPY